MSEQKYCTSNTDRSTGCLEKGYPSIFRNNFIFKSYYEKSIFRNNFIFKSYYEKSMGTLFWDTVYILQQ